MVESYNGRLSYGESASIRLAQKYLCLALFCSPTVETTVVKDMHERKRHLINDMIKSLNRDFDDNYSKLSSEVI